MSKSLSLIASDKSFSGVTHGSYYVRKLVSGWLLYHQTFQNSKKVDTRVAPLAYRELGFQPNWSVEQARSRCKILNKEKTLQHNKAVKTAAVLSNLESLNSLLFPQEKLNAFQKRLEQSNEGSEKHLLKMKSHFLKVQKICIDLEILPSDYKDNEKLVYKWFAKNQVSLDYSQKLISLMNRWGSFTSRLDGRYFEPIAPMRGISREKVREAHEDKAGVRTASKLITPSMLRNKKEHLNIQNYNFIFITIWLGLRPSELQLRPEIKTNREGLEFLIVYQTKLTSIQKSKRFKSIPLLIPEQKEAASMLMDQDFKAPIYKTMKCVFGEGYGLYAGRKGFVDLMLSKGYALEDISLWLGHTSIETTWTHYKNKNVFELNSPKVGHNQTPETIN